MLTNKTKGEIYLEKKEFKAESKRLLDLMINSIYTNKEIFLRELISNASDAIDKVYYKALKDENIDFNREDYYIEIAIDKENRELKLIDKGIGMSRLDLEENLGIIANSGSLSFKKDIEKLDEMEIIGQFGVGFYSAFMVADKVTVVSKGLGEDKSYIWISDGADGYTIEEALKEDIGTEITLKIKEDTEDESYSEFLDEYRIKEIVKRYSDFIRYPIKMELSRLDYEDDKEEPTESKSLETLNSMVPIWRKNKNELKLEDYRNFYKEKRFGFDNPLDYIHLSIDGLVSYNSILYIPTNPPYDFYTGEYEKGLELYSNGVLIMDKCGDLLPDYFSFVKGIVDSQDLSLNISREILQQDRHLKLIAKKIEEKIKEKLLSIMNDNREEYKVFFNNFGKILKFGVYNNFGLNKDNLKDLLLFYSSEKKDLVSLKEYVENMKENQKYIYYASGNSIDKIDKLPQTELVKDQGYEILYLSEDIDEFAIKVLMNYEGNEFKAVSSGDLGLEEKEEKFESEEEERVNTDLFNSMKDILGDKVKLVKKSKILKNHPVCLTTEGELSLEMEKILKNMGNDQELKADRVLELNIDHPVYEKLKKAKEEDPDRFKIYTKLLYDQALLMENLPIDDPIEFANNIAKIM